MTNFSWGRGLRFSGAALLTLGGLALTGCSSSVAKDQLPTVAVKGVVKVDGKPSGRAMLQLTPVDAKPNQPGASGTVGDDGSFALQTYAPGDGVPEGNYTVSLGPDYAKFMPVPPVKPLTIQVDKPNSSMELDFQSAGQGTVGLPRPGAERPR